MQAKIIEMLEKRIIELQYDEWRAKEAKDYPAGLYLYGATIYLKKFLREVKEMK